jgi:hypothetical protein
VKNAYYIVALWVKENTYSYSYSYSYSYLVPRLPTPPLRLILAVNFSAWSTPDVRERAAFSLGMLFHFKILNNMGIMGIKFFAF